MDSLLDNAPCGYISFKDDGAIIYCNQTLAQWTGYTKQELIDSKIEQLFTRATKIFYNTHFFPLLQLQSKADEIFITLQTKSKSDVPVIAAAKRLVEDGDAINQCAFITVFQRQQYEDEIRVARRDAERLLHENEQLARLQRSIENHSLQIERQYQKQNSQHEDLKQFGKIVSHDLQEPLRKLSLFADMLTNQLDDSLSEQNLRTISKINAAATRMRKLTTGLQQYLSVESDEAKTDVDLKATITNAAAKVSETRKLDGLNVVLNELPPIHGFQSQLALLFYHLLDNAVQFSEPSRPLRVQIDSIILKENLYKLEKDKYRFEEHIRLTISDNGIGFDSRYREYVKGLLNKLSRSSEGVGIGLPIIKRIIDNHNGDLIIDSNPGVGSTLTILFPTHIHNITPVP